MQGFIRAHLNECHEKSATHVIDMDYSLCKAALKDILHSYTYRDVSVESVRLCGSLFERTLFLKIKQTDQSPGTSAAAPKSCPSM